MPSPYRYSDEDDDPLRESAPWVAVHSVRNDLAAALLRLRILERQAPHPAIRRAEDLIRTAAGALEALAEPDPAPPVARSAGRVTTRGALGKPAIRIRGPGGHI